MGWKNIKIQSWIKLIKGSICNLSWLTMFTNKRAIIIIKNNSNNNNNNNNNNLEKSYTVKKAKHEPSDRAMFKKCPFYEKEN